MWRSECVKLHASSHLSRCGAFETERMKISERNTIRHKFGKDGRLQKQKNFSKIRDALEPSLCSINVDCQYNLKIVRVYTPNIRANVNERNIYMTQYVTRTVCTPLLRKLTPRTCFTSKKHSNNQGHDTIHYRTASVEKIHRSFCLLFFRSLRD